MAVMKKTKPSNTPAASTPAVAAILERGEFRKIAAATIDPCPFQRREFKPHDPELIELKASIERIGVLQPIIVRPHPGKPGRWELAAGDRRRRASLLAKRDLIPAIVVADMTDDEMLKIHVAENRDRKDLTPLEQAAEIQTALDHGWTFEQIATETGWDRKLCARRAQLVRLTEDWKKAWANEKTPVRSWSVAHFELIARFPETTQAKLHKEFVQIEPYRANSVITMKLDELRRRLGDSLHALAGAAWNLDDADLVKKAGPCSTCPNRSDRQPMLFEDDKVRVPEKAADSKGCGDAMCLDPACWRSKDTAYLRAKVEAAKEKHPDLVLVKDYGKSRVTVKDTKVFDSYQVRPAKKGDKDAVPSIRISGANAGSVTYVKPPSQTSSSAGHSPAKSPAQRRKEIDVQRVRHVGQAVETIIEARAKKDRPPVPEQRELLTLVALFGSQSCFGSEEKAWTTYQQVLAGAKPFDAVLDHIWTEVILGMAGACGYWCGAKETTEGIVSYFNIDTGPLWDAAAKKFPYPKDAEPKVAKAKKPATKPQKGVCHVCGCTFNSPCVDESGESCAWTDKSETLCTACEGKLLAKKKAPK